jgi:hypothetical protein
LLRLPPRGLEVDQEGVLPRILDLGIIREAFSLLSGMICRDCPSWLRHPGVAVAEMLTAMGGDLI